MVIAHALKKPAQRNMNVFDLIDVSSGQAEFRSLRQLLGVRHPGGGRGALGQDGGGLSQHFAADI
jgi:hypothetical protein